MQKCVIFAPQNSHAVLCSTRKREYMYSNPFLAVINHQPACRPPVWMMRQAGRVLPRYRALTKATLFRSIMADAKLAAEVTLMPIDDMGMDAAILFSDILVIPEALGVQVEWNGNGPAFPRPLLGVAQPASELRFDASHLTHVADTLDEIQRQKSNDTPVIGFCGGPLTCLCYMLGGRDGSLQFTEAKRHYNCSKPSPVPRKPMCICRLSMALMPSRFSSHLLV